MAFLLIYKSRIALTCLETQIKAAVCAKFYPRCCYALEFPSAPIDPNNVRVNSGLKQLSAFSKQSHFDAKSARFKTFTVTHCIKET